jgi:uncharacterized surface protein with fasciclin (FAS1) repeats
MVRLAAYAQPATVAALASIQPELGTFNRLVQQAGMQAALTASGPVTVFAPSDEAFKAVPAATLNQLSRDPEFLQALLNQHLVPGLVKSTEIDGSKTLTTASGTKINVSRAGDFVTIEDGLVTKSDITADNGVVHLIDSVLMPPKK